MSEYFNSGSTSLTEQDPQRGIELAQKVLNGVQDVLEEFRKKEAEIRASFSGKEQLIEHYLSMHVANEVQRVGAKRVPLALAAQVRDAVGASLKVTPPPVDTAAQAVLEMEVRRYLLEQYPDKLQRKEPFMDAVRKGDRVVFEAVLRAPALFDMVDDEVLEQGKREWAELKNPGRAAAHRELVALIGRVEAAIVGAEKDMRASIGLRGASTAEAARGSVTRSDGTREEVSIRDL